MVLAVAFFQKGKKFLIGEVPVFGDDVFKRHEVDDEVFKRKQSAAMLSRVIIFPVPGRRGRGKKFLAKGTSRLLALSKVYSRKRRKRTDECAAGRLVPQ